MERGTAVEGSKREGEWKVLVSEKLGRFGSMPVLDFQEKGKGVWTERKALRGQALSAVWCGRERRRAMDLALTLCREARTVGVLGPYKEREWSARWRGWSEMGNVAKVVRKNAEGGKGGEGGEAGGGARARE